jgi:hypothetical protein
MLPLFLALALTGASAAPLPPAYDVRTEYIVAPIGVTEPLPRFSWRLPDCGRGCQQVGEKYYEPWQRRLVACLAKAINTSVPIWQTHVVKQWCPHMNNEELACPHFGVPPGTHQGVMRANHAFASFNLFPHGIYRLIIIRVRLRRQQQSKLSTSCTSCDALFSIRIQESG